MPAARLGASFHPARADKHHSTCYSNLIAGHSIEQALAGDLDSDPERRDLQREAAAHISIDKGMLASDTPNGQVSLRFPAAALDVLFPRLFAST